MLITKNLSYQYNGGQMLNYPDLSFKRGEHWLILGQSGCGKTTLLHLMGAILRPQNGQININNTAIKGLSQTVLDKFRAQNIGIIFQRPHFLRSLNVEENLLLAQKLAGNETNPKAIFQILERLNISDKTKSKIFNLSEGEKQRVAIARALVNKAPIILADEPSSALDDVNCMELVKLLEEQAQKENALLVIVTHDNRLKKIFENQIILEKQ